jgi:hypothetical protein
MIGESTLAPRHSGLLDQQVSQRGDEVGMHACGCGPFVVETSLSR